MNVVALLLRRIGRYMLIYLVAYSAALIVGLAIAAVMTRSLEPSQYGRVGVALTFGSFLTILYNLGSLQGTFRLIFGISDEEVGTASEDEGVETPDGADEQRRALGTAIVLTALIGTAGTLVVACFAARISDALLDDPRHATLITLSAAAAAFAAVWRLTANVLRYDRRPVWYGIVHVSLPASILVLLGIAAATGHTDERGVLVAYAAGTIAAVTLSLWPIRKDFRMALDRRYAARIYALGASIAPVAVSFFLIQSGGVLLLAGDVRAEQIGLYRFAGSIAAFPAYVVSAFLLAWGPLSRSPLHIAVDREHGAREGGAVLVLYYVIGAGAMMVCVCGLASILVLIAPGSYADAAPLVPVLSLIPVARGWLVVVYRASAYASRRSFFIWSTVISGLVWLGLSLALIPAYGNYGAGAASILAFVVGSLILLLRAQLSDTRLPLPWGQILFAAALAIGVGVLAYRLGRDGGPAAALVALAGVLVFLGALCALRVIPPAHLRTLRDVLSSGVGSLRDQRDAANRLRALSAADQHTLVAFLRSSGDPGALPAADAETVVRGLSTVAQVAAPSTECAAEVAAYLSGQMPLGERDRYGRMLIDERGVDPLTLDRLWEATGHVRRAL